jgi:beta-glucanase (GH16 family)
LGGDSEDIKRGVAMNVSRIRWIFVAIFGGAAFIFAFMIFIFASRSKAQEAKLFFLSPNYTRSELTATLPYTTHLPIIYKDTWELIWRDEFTGSAGVNTADWNYDIGTSYPGGPANWGTGEIEVMSSSTDNVFQSDGYLHIRALHSGTNPHSGWTSGRIETVRLDFQPPPNGQMAVEARIQLPSVIGEAGQGYWPAFWMLGAPYRDHYWTWPGVGEIDIMENINGLNQWWGVLHCGTNPGGPCNEPTGRSRSVSGFSPSLQNDFHIYRIEFDKSVVPQQLRWYVDGVQQHTVLSSQVDEAAWDTATNHGFFIILNVAIGGDWAGNPTSSTASGGTMLVDYVRVYTSP